MNEWLNKCMKEQTSEWKNEQTNEWTSEQTVAEWLIRPSSVLLHCFLPLLPILLFSLCLYLCLYEHEQYFAKATAPLAYFCTVDDFTWLTEIMHNLEILTSALPAPPL